MVSVEQEHGFRFELRLLERAEAGACYQISLSALGQQWDGRANLNATSGEVEIRLDSELAPPAACLQALRATLRGVLREHAARASYPRRLARWRPLAPTANGSEA